MHNNFPSILVTMVVYHSNLDDVAQALASLKGQGASLHIIVVDNDSHPEYQTALAQLIKNAAQDGLNIEMRLANRNGGFGYGHNLAFLNAQPSEFVLVLNPDVILHGHCLSNLIAFMQLNPEAGLVVPKVFYPDGKLQPLNKRFPTVLDLGLRLFLPPALTRISIIRRRLDKYAMMDVGYDKPCHVPFASGCCMFIRRSLMMRLGGFDEQFFLYFEDADLCQRANILSQVWYCPEATITHIWQRGSRKSYKLLWIMLQSASRYFAKWGLKLW